MNKFRIILVLFSVVLPLLNPLSSYFSQDDFFHLSEIMDKKFSDIPSFFVTRLEGQTFYRPLSREVLNMFLYKLFGLNPLPFHLVNLMLILTNILLGFFIVKRLTNNLSLSSFAATLYALNPVHSIELYYLASVQILLATTLILSSSLLYLKYRKSSVFNFYLLSVVIFLLALFSHEMSVVLLPILFMTEIFIFGRKISFKPLIPFFALTCLYLMATLFASGLPKQDVYDPSFSLGKIVNTLGWYIIWSFGLPEMLVDFVGQNFSLRLNFIEWYWNYFWVATSCTTFIISSFLVLGLRFKETIFHKHFFLFIGLFVSSLIPFLFFPQHKFVYYLSLATIWFSGGLAILLSLTWNEKHLRVLSIILVTIFAILFYNTNQINKMTYWAAKRSAAAKYILEDIKKTYPVVSKEISFYLINDPNYPNISKEWGSSSKQAFYILSGADALKLLYKDPTIKVYFEDMGGVPRNLEKLDNTIIARFPY